MLDVTFVLIESFRIPSIRAAAGRSSRQTSPGKLDCYQAEARSHYRTEESNADSSSEEAPALKSATKKPNQFSTVFLIMCV